MRTISSKAIQVLVIAVVLLAAIAVTADIASAKTIKPSGKKDNTDIKAIKRAVEKNKVVTLQSGKTYYLSNPIHIKSNRTIIADGATIISKNDTLVSDLKKKGYSNIKNVTIQGGTWKSAKKGGWKKSSFVFVHGADITLKDMVINNANYDGHSCEFVACKDVLMDNVKIIPKGKAGKTEEAMVQIDIATNATYPRFKGTNFANGATCKKFVVRNCDITGNKAITSGYAYKDKKWQDRYHTGVRLVNSKFTSYEAEGVFLVNSKSAIVQGNEITSYHDKYSTDKAIGIHYLIVGKIPGTKFILNNNIVRGGKYGIRCYSTSGTKLGDMTITNNQVYCKRGASNAIMAASKGISNLVVEGNQTFNW